MRNAQSSLVVLAACVIVCSAQPAQKLSVLKDQPAEVLFRESQPAVLECITEGNENGIKYTWLKDGKAFNLQDNVAQRKDEGTLVFLKPEAKDEGKYQCHAETSAGIASTRPISFKKTYLDRPAVKTQDVTPTEGRPFQLDCAIPDAYPKPTITWRTQLAADPDVIDAIVDERITQSPDGNLHIASVNRDDVSQRFNYVCFAKSPAVDDEVPLAVYSIKDLTKDTKPKDSEMVPIYVKDEIVGRAGEVAIIYCIFGGEPLAHPDWFKDGKDVNGEPGGRITRYNRSAGKRLLFREVLPEDEGQYVCELNNEIGKVQRHTTTLKVVSAPRFVKKPEKIVIAKQGQDAIIPCEMSALPPAKVSWTYNAKPLSNDRATVTDSGLAIKGVQKSDRGYYACSAHNEHGEAFADTLLHVA